MMDAIVMCQSPERMVAVYELLQETKRFDMAMFFTEGLPGLCGATPRKMVRRVEAVRSLKHDKVVLRVTTVDGRTLFAISKGWV